MQIRFTLDTKIDASLIDRIEQRANGGSTNEAAKFLIRFWFELESGQNLTPARRDMTPECQSDDINLSGLDAINLEF